MYYDYRPLEKRKHCDPRCWCGRHNIQKASQSQAISQMAGILVLAESGVGTRRSDDLLIHQKSQILPSVIHHIRIVCETVAPLIFVCVREKERRRRVRFYSWHEHEDRAPVASLRFAFFISDCRPARNVWLFFFLATVESRFPLVKGTQINKPADNLDVRV